jgi:hypothetical protein
MLANGAAAVTTMHRAGGPIERGFRALAPLPAEFMPLLSAFTPLRRRSSESHGARPVSQEISRLQALSSGRRDGGLTLPHFY